MLIAFGALVLLFVLIVVVLLAVGLRPRRGSGKPGHRRPGSQARNSSSSGL